MWSFLILLTLPQLYMCQFDWKVEQPVSYVIYNGKYYPNPTANIKPLEEEASASSFLEGLNPLNAFSTIWNSLPSLNIFGTSDLVDDESDFADGGGAGTEVGENQYQKAQHGSTYSFVPSLHNVGGSGLFAGSPAPIKAELPFNLDKIASHPSNPFQMYNSRRRKRSLSPRAGSTLTFYKPLGQGSFMKYEIIPENDHANEAGKERRRPRPVERPSPSRPLKTPLTPYMSRPSLSPLRRFKSGEHNSRKYSTSQSKSVERTESKASAKAETMEESPCPKFGNWDYDGEKCISIGPIPRWACRPKDLLTTGKLVVCRNKIFFP